MTNRRTVSARADSTAVQLPPPASRIGWFAMVPRTPTSAQRVMAGPPRQPVVEKIASSYRGVDRVFAIQADGGTRVQGAAE